MWKDVKPASYKEFDRVNSERQNKEPRDIGAPGWQPLVRLRVSGSPVCGTHRRHLSPRARALEIQGLAIVGQQVGMG